MKVNVQDILKQHNLRETELRKTILSLFLNAAKPLSVPQMQEMLISLGVEANKTTLYRQVELFLRLNILKELHLEPEKIHYEYAEIGHHHHLICNNCQKIEHIEVPNIEFHLQTLEKETQEEKGFHISSHTLELYGLCKKCLLT